MVSQRKLEIASTPWTGAQDKKDKATHDAQGGSLTYDRGEAI